MISGIGGDGFQGMGRLSEEEGEPRSGDRSVAHGVSRGTEVLFELFVSRGAATALIGIRRLPPRWGLLA
jgi:hypothetical protein